MTNKTPAQLASAAAESVRQLNHVTFNPGGRDGWQYPGDAYSVLGGLDQVAGAMEQALDQTWALLSGLAADGHLTSRGNTDRELTDARAALDEARAAADRLVTALGRAHSATSGFAYTD